MPSYLGRPGLGEYPSPTTHEPARIHTALPSRLLTAFWYDLELAHKLMG